MAEGRRVPFSGQLLVDESRVIDMIDRLRAATPDEIKQARRQISEHEQQLALADARVRAAMDEGGVSAAITTERERLLSHALREADEIRAGADDYAHQVLSELEARLARVLAGVQKGLAELNQP